MINVFQPSLGQLEIEAVRRVIERNWIGAGPELERFRNGFAAHAEVDARRLVTVASCTEGLFQAIAALGIGPGDEVVLPTMSFVGAGHAVVAAGARPVLCDIDDRTLNPTEGHVEAAVTHRTKAVIVLHYGGHPGRIEAIASMLRRRSIPLIEDAACAVGSRLNGRLCGTFGDIGLWSFDAMKILVTGDGGIVYTRTEELAHRIAQETFLGIDAAGVERAARALAWWEVDPALPGRRARMNDLTGAIGNVQLERLPAFLRRRQEIAARYDAGLSGLPWLVPPPAPENEAISSWYFYWVQVPAQRRDALARHLLAADIYTTFKYWPLHRMRLYASDKPFPGADAATERTLLLPIHQGLLDVDIDRVIDAVLAFDSIG